MFVNLPWADSCACEISADVLYRVRHLVKKLYPTANIGIVNRMLAVAWTEMPKVLEDDFTNAFYLKKDEWCIIGAKLAGVVDLSEDPIAWCRKAQKITHHGIPCIDPH
jgi:hypothetical protein